MYAPSSLPYVRCFVVQILGPYLFDPHTDQCDSPLATSATSLQPSVDVAWLGKAAEFVTVQWFQSINQPISSSSSKYVVNTKARIINVMTTLDTIELYFENNVFVYLPIIKVCHTKFLLISCCACANNIYFLFLVVIYEITHFYLVILDNRSCSVGTNRYA